MGKLNDYESKLLMGWEDVHKKSQLTLWVLLSLKDGSKPMADIKNFMSVRTSGLMSADDKSMYRALRRFKEAGLISYSERESQSGPKHKVFDLTKEGTNVLEQFIQRNIADVYLSKINMKLLGLN